MTAVGSFGDSSGCARYYYRVIRLGQKQPRWGAGVKQRGIICRETTSQRLDSVSKGVGSGSTAADGIFEEAAVDPIRARMGEASTPQQPQTLNYQRRNGHSFPPFSASYSGMLPAGGCK